MRSIQWEYVVGWSLLAVLGGAAGGVIAHHLAPYYLGAPFGALFGSVFAPFMWWAWRAD